MIGLEDFLAGIEKTDRLITVCASCKKVRDAEGCWNEMNADIIKRFESRFTHGICSECIERLYPEYAMMVKKK